jgi:hypothetical protein
MKNYVIEDLDILDKVAHVYMGDHLVESIPYKKNHPYSAVFDQIKNGSKPIHIKEYNKIPSIGMIYSSGIFINGENGETFIDVENGIRGYPLIKGSSEAIVTISEFNKVDGCFVVFMKFKNWTNETFEGLFAALTSNPNIIIEDNVSNKFDYLNNIDLTGTTKKIPELSDVELFYSSRWES